MQESTAYNMTMGGHIQLARHATLELQQFQQTRVLIHGTRNNYGSVKNMGKHMLLLLGLEMNLIYF